MNIKKNVFDRDPQGVLILCIGLPGSGKTTVGKKFAEKYTQVVYQSMGDLLRAEAQLSTERGNIVHECVSQGKLVPLVMAIDILGNFLAQHQKKIIILDGYQGTLEYVAPFDALLDRYGFVLKKVIAFDVPIQVALARSRGRMRSDDAPEVLAQRMSIRLHAMDDIKQWYAKKNALAVLNANQPLDCVIAECDAIIQSCFLS